MLNTILNLFGRSPFAPLQLHMDKVSECVQMLPKLFQAIDDQDYTRLEQIAAAISDLEHQADQTKNEMRNNLPKSLFLPIDRSYLFDILTIQDRIADAAEDLAVLTTLKPLKFSDRFRKEFFEVLQKNLEAFHGAQLIIREINELVESSFGGVEAQKVRSMVDTVASKEHEGDLIQRKLLKSFFQAEAEMNYSTFDLWQRIFQTTAAISNLSENLAYKVSMTLELK